MIKVTIKALVFMYVKSLCEGISNTSLHFGKNNMKTILKKILSPASGAAFLITLGFIQPVYADKIKGVGQEGSFLDASGHYAGHIDRGGRVENRDGKYAGTIRVNGKFENTQGQYAGLIDDKGRFEDSNGTYSGRLKDDGAVEDAAEKYLGRVSHFGLMEDAQGHYAGSVPQGDDVLGAVILLIRNKKPA